MDITPFLNAFKAHQWPLLVALLVGLFIAVAKQGQLGTWAQKKLPPKLIPLYAPLLGALGVFSTEVVSGGSPAWKQAVIDAINFGLSGGFLAVFGHELVIEQMRKGKEIIPEKQLPPAPPAGPITKRDPDATQDPNKPLGRMRIDAALLPWPTLALGLGLGCYLYVAPPACTPAAVAAEQVVANIADGACTQLDAQPEPGWVYFVCALVQAAGANVTNLTVKVPADQAPKFAAAHPRAQVSDELAARLKGVEHLALPPKAQKTP